MIWQGKKRSCGNELLAFVQSRETVGINESLIAAISLEKARLALFQMHLIKALGPDDLRALFYQRFWNIIGLSIHRFVYRFFGRESRDR